MQLWFCCRSATTLCTDFRTLGSEFTPHINIVWTNPWECYKLLMILFENIVHYSIRTGTFEILHSHKSYHHLDPWKRVRQEAPWTPAWVEQRTPGWDPCSCPASRWCCTGPTAFSDIIRWNHKHCTCWLLIKKNQSTTTLCIQSFHKHTWCWQNVIVKNIIQRNSNQLNV